MELIKNDALWFGNYGGCFVADAFSMHCDRYYGQFIKAIEDPGFRKEFEQLKAKYRQEFRLLDDRVLLIPENYDATIGTALLHKCLSKKQALIGCRYAEDALFAAKLCQDLGISLKMYVTMELSQDRTLMEHLKLSDVEVNEKNCQELINHPEMYCFQEWLADSQDKHIIQIRANVGAFPQVNVASYFLRQYVEEFKEFVSKHDLRYKKLVIPVVSGSSALGLIEADSGKEYMTVECDVFDDLIEELDSFCGTFTKVERNNLVDRVLCPQLCQLWDENKVCRVRTDRDVVCKENVLRYPGLSLASYAVLNYADEDSLLLVKARKEGMDL